MPSRLMWGLWVHAAREWTQKQIAAAEQASVAVLYASAYGNTAALAQAISRGITKAGKAPSHLNAWFACTHRISDATPQYRMYQERAPCPVFP